MSGVKYFLHAALSFIYENVKEDVSYISASPCGKQCNEFKKTLVFSFSMPAAQYRQYSPLM